MALYILYKEPIGLGGATASRRKGRVVDRQNAPAMGDSGPFGWRMGCLSVVTLSYCLLV